MRNQALADPDFALSDIVPSYLENIGLVGGPKGYLPGRGARLYGLPCGAETSVLAYRRDLFAQHGFKPPRTYTQLQALLQPLREKNRHRGTDLTRANRPQLCARLAVAPQPFGRPCV